MPAMSLPAGVRLWQAVALAAVTVAAAVIDLKVRRVPNWLTYPAILLGLGGHALAGGLEGSGEAMGLAGAGVGLAVGFGPLALCWLAGGIGGGDVKLMGAIGALGGWRLALSAMLYGFLAAAGMAVAVMIRRRIVRRTLRRVLHTMVLLVAPGARPADPTGADSPKIPFAVALCVGTIAAMISSAVRTGWFAR